MPQFEFCSISSFTFHGKKLVSFNVFLREMFTGFYLITILPRRFFLRRLFYAELLENARLEIVGDLQMLICAYNILESKFEITLKT
mmetsp:Transcript_6715/g.10625  ORF Transcript_6715/g.10625 Transcript_6715/m.10625 type:complete len:86 (-) Transcript_6715:812-1069(-)